MPARVNVVGRKDRWGLKSFAEIGPACPDQADRIASAPSKPLVVWKTANRGGPRARGEDVMSLNGYGTRSRT